MTNPQHAQSRDRGKPRPVSIVESPELVEHTDAIRSLGKQTVANVISIGEHLTECRRIVGHGFRAWLKREFDWTYKTSDNFMNVHKLVESRCENFSHLSLPVSSLYLLAAPSTPEAARQEIISRAEKGEKVKVVHVKGAIRAARPAKNPSKTVPPAAALRRLLTPKNAEPMPTAAEAEESYQETLYDQACLLLESMADETRQRFHIKENYAAAAASQMMPGSIGPMLPGPADPWADLDIPPSLDRRGPSLEERYRALEIEAIGLRSEIEELKTENAKLKAELAKVQAVQGLMAEAQP
jgi:Protein of unknown function (DUF3102)